MDGQIESDRPFAGEGHSPGACARSQLMLDDGMEEVLDPSLRSGQQGVALMPLRFSVSAKGAQFNFSASDADVTIVRVNKVARIWHWFRSWMRRL